jgi:hypothetical protein
MLTIGFSATDLNTLLNCGRYEGIFMDLFSGDFTNMAGKQVSFINLENAPLNKIGIDLRGGKKVRLTNVQLTDWNAFSLEIDYKGLFDSSSLI